MLGRDFVARHMSTARLVLDIASRDDELDLGIEAADQIGHDRHRLEPLDLRDQARSQPRTTHQSRQVAIGPPRLVP